MAEPMASLTVEPNPRVTAKVIHEDDDLIVVSKPTRVVTQPGVGHEHDTLLNGLFATHGTQLQRLGRDRDFGLVHRLDRETSGILVVALSIPAYEGLREAFKKREVRKYYLAACDKAPNDREGVIKRPIIEDETRKDRYTREVKARVTRAGKPAVTAYRVLDEVETKEALIEARAVTGRLHQVRVHLASIGAGILGDTVYGPRRTSVASKRLALHASRLGFTHPVTGEKLRCEAPLTKDFRTLLRRIGLRLPDEIARDNAEPSPADLETTDTE